MRITKKLIYAIEAVVDIAYHSAEDAVQASDIAQRQGIPKRYLEQVLQQLVRAQILTGVRGPQGGYRLAREKRRINLCEICDVIHEIEAVIDPINHSSSELGKVTLQPVWQELYIEMRARMEATTIETLCDRAVEAGISPSKKARSDFVI